MRNEDFLLNRFDFSDLIKSIQKAEVLPNILTDNETGIEFYGGNSISRENFIDFLENFNILDNLAQNDSRQEYEKHKQLGVENFQFEPSWVKIVSDKVVIGYIGIYVNTDFNLTFSKVDGAWILVK